MTTDEPVPPAPRSRRTLHRRRGGIYVLVLGCAMIVTVIGLSALALIGVERRFAEGTGDFTQARFYAKSAIEIGLLRMYQDATWRTTYGSGVWEANRPIGTGTYTLEGIDPMDNDLSDFARDPVILTGTGMQGDARYKLQVTLVADPSPLDALRTCVHSSGQFYVNTGTFLVVTDGPASTNGTLSNAGTIVGDVEVKNLSGTGTITGTTTIDAPAKDAPDNKVFDEYFAKATAIPYTGNITQQVLSPGYNPWGTPNPDGVYHLDCSGSDLSIGQSRIQGTLVVSCTGKTLTIDSGCLLQANRADYPTLIVKGNVNINLASSTANLSESTNGVNYNPPGAPYAGESDSDQLDVYPTEIQGLVHVTGNVASYNTSRVRGVIISEGTVTVQSALEVIHNPSLYTNPPQGYTVPKKMIISEGTWRQIVD